LICYFFKKRSEPDISKKEIFFETVSVSRGPARRRQC
jgi:hypothetical protein